MVKEKTHWLRRLMFLPCVLQNEGTGTVFAMSYPWPGSKKGYNKEVASGLYLATLSVAGLGKPEE